jgi:hypothetical protein
MITKNVLCQIVAAIGGTKAVYVCFDPQTQESTIDRVPVVVWSTVYYSDAGGYSIEPMVCDLRKDRSSLAFAYDLENECRRLVGVTIPGSYEPSALDIYTVVSAIRANYAANHAPDTAPASKPFVGWDVSSI